MGRRHICTAWHGLRAVVEGSHARLCAVNHRGEFTDNFGGGATRLRGPEVTGRTEPITQRLAVLNAVAGQAHLQSLPVSPLCQPCNAAPVTPRDSRA
jgi:hypothetical protein